MNTRDQRICLGLVPFFGALFLVGCTIFPGFFRPLSPSMTADEVAAFYRDHVGQIRASVILFNLIGIGFIPFFMVIVVQMMRMGNPSRAFAYSYLAAAVSGGTLFALADLAWLNAAARPDRDPQLTMLLNDLAWFSFTTPVGFIITQNLVLALAIYMDALPEPVFPRWVAHFNIVSAVLMVPGAFALLYKTGPFAWDGALSFWLRIATFTLYVAVMFFVVRATINRQVAREERALAEAAAT
jgi:hypothetical protein